MAPLSSRRPNVAGRLDLVAAAWGGLVASIGLMAGSGRDWPARLTAAALSFGLGGFLAAVRAAARRPFHALAAWVAAYVIYACFVLIARIIEELGGPDAPELVAGGGTSWLIAALWALVFALLGGVLANTWLRPAGRRGVS
ncbi:MAG TPA: hypothetical protein VHK00_06640 [Miltoncostaeaceae bacterium]|nr:hypothetical protein [Miltoncostaeaceae bacterium]